MEKNEFKPLSFWRELRLPKDKLPNYYRNKREYEYKNNLILKGMAWRKVLHPVLLSLMKIDRKFINKQTLTVIGNKQEKSEKPVIYAITHIGMYDYQIVSEAIKKHQYPFAGDPETMYRSADGLILSLNGLVYCDTESKTDRFIAQETAKEVLKRNTNLLIYPEGVWNVTSNLLSLPLFPGIINIAMETSADIVPVAIEQYGKDFFVNIGKNMEIDPYIKEENRKSYIDGKREELRDCLATLKWEIYENAPTDKRCNLKSYEEEYQDFLKLRFDEWKNPETKQPYYDESLIRSRTYKEKGIDSPEEVFSYMEKLNINKNNAFIFRKDNSLPSSIQKTLKKSLRRK